MTTITPDEMKSLETLFMSETGTPSILLMEHAAQGVAAALSRHAPKSARVLFLCGPGNNGGDGYAAARLWCSGGGQADVWEVTSAVRGDALTNRTLALLHGVRVLPSVDAVDVAEYAAVVDALYGTPALAKGGSGDVLSGILTALLCQRNRLSTSLSTSALAAYGVLIHALAGLRAEKRFGANCSTPQALIDAIRLDDKEL